MKSPSISFHTLGCRLNQSETAVIQHSFENESYKVVDIKKPADIVVINTCTVTENGDADTRRLVNKVNRLNPHVRIALIGCQAQVQKNKLTLMQNVQWVVGNERKMDLASIIKELNDNQPHVITPPISRESFTQHSAGIDRKHIRASLKIQDGCDFFCSFCEIPYARGRARSRKFNDLLLDAKALVAAGHKELVITGINVGTYKESGYKILDVIDALEDIDGLERIRLSSIEPTTIPEKLLTKMAQKTKLCRYLHIPLQSANDKILTAMKRKYTFAKFNEFINKAFETVPEICIGTDIIVGFPGESEKEFEDTVIKLKESPIHYFHVFSYSSRNIAQSRSYQGAVAQLDIQKRSKILRSLSQRKRIAFYHSFLGSKQQVLFEQRKNGMYSGLTDNYIRIYAKAKTSLTNKVKTVQLLKANVQYIEGAILN